MPVFLSDTEYDLPAPAANNAPSIPGLFLRGGGNLALVDPGGPAPLKCCDMLLNRDKWPTFPTDTVSRQDLLLFLPVDTKTPLDQLDVEITGQNGLQVSADPAAAAQALQHVERYTYRPDLGPTGTDGKRIDTGWVARIPIQFTPTHPWDIGGVRYPIDVAATYRSAGDSQPHTL
ncbi:MAG TPA: hypothetical protein VF916_04215, partial [Ktedonobacterales bacterium]